MSVLEEFAPMYVGAEALRLSRADALAPLRAFYAVDIAVDYSGAGESGVVLPLEQLVTGPSPVSFERHIFTRVAPSIITFTPKEGGEYLVLLREVAHNKLWGRIQLTIAGEQLAQRRRR